MKKLSLIMLPVLLFAIFAFSIGNQNRTVTGKVTDEKGKPVETATVTIIGTRHASVTDQNGNYRLSNVAPDAVIRISGVNIIAREVNSKNDTVVNIVVTISKVSLESVIICKDNSNVQTQLVNGRPVNVAQALSGKVEGLKINNNSSSIIQPRIVLRGLRSVTDDDGFDREGYSNISENGFHKVKDEPLSTFSIDVDAASYSNVRRFLNNNELPPAGAVRTEEMVNYFKYSYPQPEGKDPFSINTEISTCPWSPKNKLVLIGLQGKNIPVENLPASNIVFLIDVSGSMSDENKLPLVKSSMKMLTDQLREQDKISIVVYAGNAGLVLPATSGSDKTKIKTAIDALEAGGSTAGGAGIKLAYKTALENFKKGGNNRVILCTDGDFNVGASSDDEMVKLIEAERNKGIFLTVLGYGMGNYQDAKMQQLADKGNGNHNYIDNITEAKKVLVNEFGGTLFTIAKDVKLQVEFNPAKVAGYRLIGYENRLLNKEDFNDDKKDAGELGSGHTVTALYEIIPAGVKSDFLADVDKLKYQKEKNIAPVNFSDELFTVKFRYKTPDGDKSDLIVHAVKDAETPFKSTSDNFRFAAAVADFAMLLRQSKYTGGTDYNYVISLATGAKGADAEGYRKEFISLVQQAERIRSLKAKTEKGSEESLGKAD